MIKSLVYKHFEPILQALTLSLSLSFSLALALFYNFSPSRCQANLRLERLDFPFTPSTPLYTKFASAPFPLKRLSEKAVKIGEEDGRTEH